jgi:hypothetical protein
MQRNPDPADTAESYSDPASTAAGAEDGSRTRRPRGSRRISRKCYSSNIADNSRHIHDLAALLRAELDEPTILAEDGERRSITKREAIVAGLVDRSARADLQATKLLVELLGKIQPTAGAAEPEQLDAADEKVVATVLSRLGMAE